MPQGVHHATPSGLWWQNPTKSSIPRLFGISCLKIAGLAALLLAIQQYRSLSYKYTYTTFIGKTMSLGPLNILTHEPLSAEEIDKLKAAQARK